MAPEGLGPFYNQITAADYCGYSVDYFRRLEKMFPVRRSGINKNRYARADLDEWMINANANNGSRIKTERVPIKLEV